jgi:hypothetical protein
MEFVEYSWTGLNWMSENPVWLVAELCDRLADLSDVFTPLEIEFLREVVNRLFKGHVRKKAGRAV